MRTILDVLRLRLDARLSERNTARSVGVPRTTVQDYLARFRGSGLAWPLPREVDEAALDRALFLVDVPVPEARRALPDWAPIARQKKRKGVTLHLLWQEYRSVEPAGYGYSQFAEHYRRWRVSLDPVLRQEYRAGERTFVDYAGLTVDVVDPTTGDVRTAQLVVAALDASNYRYAEATWAQQLPDWIASHVRMLKYFGGVSALIIPDNLRSGVTYASYYEPEINATYAEFAAHYGTAILPTRVVRPRDNAFVESFNSRVRDERLIQHWLLSLAAARRTITAYGLHYTTARRHSAGEIAPRPGMLHHSGRAIKPPPLSRNSWTRDGGNARATLPWGVHRLSPDWLLCVESYKYWLAVQASQSTNRSKASRCRGSFHHDAPRSSIPTVHRSS